MCLTEKEVAWQILSNSEPEQKIIAAVVLLETSFHIINKAIYQSRFLILFIH